MRFPMKAFRSLLVLFLAVSAAYAQGVGVGSITGIVSDATELAVPGVRLEARNTASNVVTTALSNEAGNYLIANLIPGTYVLTAEAPGFKKYLRSDLTVKVGDALRINVDMQVGAVTESIDVVAAAPVVETETGARGVVIDNRKITQLPLSGRNVYQLINLTAGAAPDQSGRTRINGSRGRSNEFLVDGVTQVIPETRGDQIAPPPIDSIEEFKILTNAYAAEYGNVSGGLVNVATKSGTNQYRATLWEFLRNDKLNTRNFFAPPNQPKPVLRQNQFGVAGGGPVWLPGLYNGRDRTFFFADYEGRRVRGQSVFNVTVPTPAMKAGDLNAFLGPSLGTDSIGRAVRQGQVYDPATQRMQNGQLIRDPFPDNRIPAARFDPVALRMLDFWPAPTNAALNQNFQRATASGSDVKRFDIRGDHVLSARDRVFARYSRFYSISPSVSPFLEAGVYGFNPTTQTEQTLTGSWNTTVSPTKLNEVRVAYLNWDRSRVPATGRENAAQELGIPNITTKAGTPYIDVSDIRALGEGAAFIVARDQVVSLIDHFSMVRGRHAFKLGGEVRTYRLRNLQPGAMQGLFRFRSPQTSLPGSFQARTGQAFGSFLMGLVNETQYTQKDPGQVIKNVTYAGFWQDDFKLSRRLTLNIGVRYELNTRLHDARGFHSTFDLGAGRVLAGPAKPDTDLDTNNVAPRFGFALDLFGNQRTVLRGGYGIFYQPIVGSGGSPLAGVPKFPFEFTSTAISPNGLDPVTRLSQGPVLQQEFDINDPRLGFGTSVSVESRNLAPYVQQWNFGIEHALASHTVIGAAYVGAAGKKHEIGNGGWINLNQVPIELAQRAGREQNTTNPATSALKPYPDFARVQVYLPRVGNSNYHSLQLKAERRFTGGLTFLAAYTWSKSIDNGHEVFGFTGGSSPQDIYNLRAERAIATADVPQRFTVGYVWDLPFGARRKVPLRGAWNAIAGGWQISGLTTLSSGRPFDVEQATNTTATFSELLRPNLNGNPELGREERTLNRYFDTSMFSAAIPLTFGTSPRNPLRGPGLVNFDAAVIKEWTFQEKRAVEFRFEMFNLTNTPPFLGAAGGRGVRTIFNPNLPLGSQSFGRIAEAGDGRVLQLGLKIRL